MALPAAPEFRWGTNHENVISFDHPAVLDDVRTWRQPGVGSYFVSNPAGVSDAWITSRDFMLAGRARWFDPTRWNGGLGLQDFIDWAAEGNSFRFVPDNRYPTYWLTCYLVEPLSVPEPGLERGGGQQTIDLIIRCRDDDFGLARRGLIFEYLPGSSITDPYTFTFTRATTGAYTDSSGGAQSAASGVLRDRHYDSGYRTTRIMNGPGAEDPDILYRTNAPPIDVPITMYLKFIERGAKDTASGNLINLGGTSNPRLVVRRAAASSVFEIEHHNGSSSVTKDTGALGHSAGALIEVRAIRKSTGAVLIGISIDGGAETVSTTSGALTPATYDESRIILGSDGSGNQPSELPLIRAAIGLGEYSMTEMRTL